MFFMIRVHEFIHYFTPKHKNILLQLFATFLMFFMIQIHEFSHFLLSNIKNTLLQVFTSSGVKN